MPLTNSIWFRLEMEPGGCHCTVEDIALRLLLSLSEKGYRMKY